MLPWFLRRVVTQITSAPKARTVDEIDMGHVQHQVALAGGVQCRHLLTQGARLRAHDNAPLHLQNSYAFTVVFLYVERHAILFRLRYQLRG